MKENTILKALREGQVQYGCGYGQIRQQEAIVALARAGFTWAFVDMEHGPFDFETIRAASAVTVPLIGRAAPTGLG